MTGIDFVHAPLEKREAVSLVRGQVQALLPVRAQVPVLLRAKPQLQE